MIIVTEVVTVEGATILVSTSKDAVVEFEAKADVPAQDLELADGEAKFLVRRNQGVGFAAIGMKHLTPLLQLTFRTSEAGISVN